MKFKSLLLKRRFEIGYFLLNTGAGEETRTPTHKAPEPKSGASTNFATPAGVKKEKLDGVAREARTLDNRNHNPGLYQLSYSHHSKIFAF